MGKNIAAQATSGPINKVPCPWCKKENDFTQVDDLMHESDASQGQGDPGGGPIYECDHCKRPMRVVAVRVLKVISVRQVS